MDISEIRTTVTFFESPHRIVATLTEAQEYLGDRPIMVGRELTKVHQEFLYGTAADLAARLTNPRGEFTVVVGPAPAPIQRSNDLSDKDVAVEFNRTAETSGGSRRQALGLVARKIGKSTREVYAAVERAKKSGI